MKPAPTPPRRGLALIGVILTLTVISTLFVALGWQIVANRRQVEHRRFQLQAAWLARAGFELACDRLLGDPADYTGETVAPLGRSRVRVEVKAAADGRFQVVSEARFPTDAPDPVVRVVTRQCRRVSDGDRVHIEVLAPKDGGPEKPERGAGR